MSVTPTIRVVDDDSDFRTAISRLLKAAGFAVRQYASAGAFLLAETDETPGCMLLDLRMPGPSGLDLQDALAKRDLALPVIFLSGHGEVTDSVQAMKAGAVDFLTKPVKKEVLLSVVRKALVRDEETRTSRKLLRDLRTRYETLSPRERVVLRHVVSGRLNKQIAADIGASERTVKAHRARVMLKMQAGSVADLVRAADQLGAARDQQPALAGD